MCKGRRKLTICSRPGGREMTRFGRDSQEMSVESRQEVCAQRWVFCVKWQQKVPLCHPCSMAIVCEDDLSRNLPLHRRPTSVSSGALSKMRRPRSVVMRTVTTFEDGSAQALSLGRAVSGMGMAAPSTASGLAVRGWTSRHTSRGWVPA